MTKKNITITSLAAVLVLAMAAWAIAGPGYGKGYGRGGCGNGANSAYSQLTPEKQAAVDKIVEKYSDQFSNLRTEMWTKHSTLQAMVNGGNADEAKIGKLTTELRDLRDKMVDLRAKMSDELVAETGIQSFGAAGGCPAYGQGNRNANCYGQGKRGENCSGGGYGRGCQNNTY